jgi:hypothetical protein
MYENDLDGLEFAKLERTTRSLINKGNDAVNRDLICFLVSGEIGG